MTLVQLVDPATADPEALPALESVHRVMGLPLDLPEPPAAIEAAP